MFSQLNEEINLEWLLEDIRFMTTSVIPDYVLSLQAGGEKKYRMEPLDGSVKTFKMA